MHRSRTLDFFRCIGVLLVLLHHLFIYKRPHHFSTIPSLLIVGGNIGVDLFFVLSGFLIASLVYKENDKYGSFKPFQFLIRRGFKIYPLYYFIIAIGYIAYYFLKTPFPRQDVIGETFFFINYKNSGNPPLGHLWSISVEEHFYLFLSFLLFFLIKFRKLTLKVVAFSYLFFFMLGLCSRAFNTWKYTDDFWKIYSPSHNRFDSLFFGVLLAYIYCYRKKLVLQLNRFKYPIIIVSLLILFQNFNPYFPQTLRMIFLLGFNSICFGFIIFYLFQNMRFEKSKLLNPFVFLGRFSYSIYIFHTLIILICYHYFSRNTLLFYTFSIFLSFFIGILLSKLIERPFLFLRDKLFPSKLSVISK